MSPREDLLSIVRSRIERSSPPLRAKLPYVTLSYAQSMDGSIAYRPGRPLALSGKESTTMTHQLRSIHDGILVGIGTILADNPRLTVRHANGDSPQPVIVDSRLRFPLDAKVLQCNRRPPWIATSERSDRRREGFLLEAGVKILRVPSHPDGLIDLAALLRELRKREIGSGTAGNSKWKRYGELRLQAKAWRR